jgi:hypothetical protein
MGSKPLIHVKRGKGSKIGKRRRDEKENVA